MTSIRFLENAIYFEDADILAVADLHLGRRIKTPLGEQSVNPQIEDNLKELVQKINPGTIVFNGDTFNHQIPVSESVETIKSVLDASPEMEAVFIVGNHEEREENIEDFIEGAESAYMEYTSGDIVFAHGHTPIESEGDVYVIGHLHPSVSNGNSRDRAYMKGHLGESVVVALPAFNHSITGTNLQEVNLDSVCPVLGDCDNFLVSRDGGNWTELQ